MTQNDTEATLAYLKKQADSDTHAWKGLCLKLARTARGLPGGVPSALAAMEMTPTQYRVPLAQARKGMVAYWDDPNDSNPFGHIATIHGRDKAGVLHVWSNMTDGTVRLVRASYFTEKWGDPAKFAASWLNGFELDLPERKPPLAAPGGFNVRNAITLLEKAAKYHRAKGNTRLTAALERDLDDLYATLKKYS